MLFNKGHNEDSDYYFSTIVIKKYPKSSKVCECVFNIALIKQHKQDTQKAKAACQEVIKRFPKSEFAKLSYKSLDRLCIIYEKEG
ncbi:tetratricopeptide repeat protein [Candidatus Pantoea carbekii]|uniref:Outer membrane lipoprotein BamD-like domain-containing protein n=2 Tax=Candidatus Pantoea carbekii TaxID=1235990 RepID=U3U3H6_9GAMM|nr:hypothetical protein HHS_07460 [Candidatus Pantoea carbekii]